MIPDIVNIIIALCVERNKKHGGFIKYLKSKGIKVSAGHSAGADLSSCSQITHLYNALSPFDKLHK